jgi:peptidoglycan/xylan/chitin deacetylase (PgdA/CDA1 family)
MGGCRLLRVAQRIRFVRLAFSGACCALLFIGFGACHREGPGDQCASQVDEVVLDANIAADSTTSDDSSSCEPEGAAPEYSPSWPIGYYDGDPLPDHWAFLTIDDGPTDWTADFLDILQAEGVHATFFVNAKNTKPDGFDGTYIDNGQTIAYGDLLLREQQEGHVIGNHTVDHADLSTLPTSEMVSELDDNQVLINEALIKRGGYPILVTLLRPPYSRPWEYPDAQPPDYNQMLLAVGSVFVERGINVFFNLDSTDSDDGAIGETYLRNPPYPPPTPPNAPTWAAKVARIEQTVLGDPRVAAGEGLIIVFHDTHPTSRDALPTIIDGLRAAGYAFGTMEDYVTWRWNRTSADMTPGPNLFNACVPVQDWGCQAFGSDEDRALEVCGQWWAGFQAVGGTSVLGEPAGEPVYGAGTGTIVQAFTTGTLELLPQYARPCNVRVGPPSSGATP